MPALLLAMLAVRDVKLLDAVFGRVADSGKMLRNFVQFVRSGVTGRKSLGSRPKKLVQHWLLTVSESQLLHAAVGSTPSGFRLAPRDLPRAVPGRSRPRAHCAEIAARLRLGKAHRCEPLAGCDLADDRCAHPPYAAMGSPT